MSLTKFILRFAALIPKIEQFDRFLFIGPHPDDIEIGAGATAAKLAAAGKKVCFLICTDGRYGEGNVPQTGDALAQLRREEAIAVSTRSKNWPAALRRSLAISSRTWCWHLIPALQQKATPTT